MSDHPKRIEDWLAMATRGLEPTIRERLKVELASHYYDACDDLICAGCSEADAEKQALSALGDVHAARQFYRREYALAAPWIVADFPPRKLEDEDYGYLKGNRLIGCSRNELIELCRKGDTVCLAWTPELEKLVPVETIPFLFEAIKQGRIKSARESIWLGIANIAFIVGAGRGDLFTSSIRHNLLWIGFLALAPVLSLVAWRKARALTPEVLAKEVQYWEATQWLNFRKAPLVAGACILTALAGLAGLISHFLKLPYEQAVGLTRLSALQGEWWRFFTALASPDIAGVFIVLLGLILFGRRVELAIGQTLLALVFMSAALAGAFFTVALNREMLMGATAGIFGLLGFLATIRTNEPFLLEQKLPMARLILIASIVSVVGFDLFYSAANLGGLLCGLAWGRFLKKPESFARTRIAQIGSAVAMGSYIGGALGAILILVYAMVN